MMKIAACKAPSIFASASSPNLQIAMSSSSTAFDVDVKSTFTCLYAKQCNVTLVINTEMASARVGF